MSAAEFVFFFNDTATTEIYTLSLHDALPIWKAEQVATQAIKPHLHGTEAHPLPAADQPRLPHDDALGFGQRSEEHTSELQSRQYLVCRLLLEKKKKETNHHTRAPNL